jgi:two-component system chemotaxis response regulator CheY
MIQPIADIPVLPRTTTMAQTILLVEDSPTIRNIIKVYLMGGQYEFVEADGGARGLQLARLMPLDLVIADINMPGMDGITFLRELRADEQARVRNLPVILLTGEKSEELKAKGLKAGANDFIRKPVSSAGLVEIVNKHLKGGSA